MSSAQKQSSSSMRWQRREKKLGAVGAADLSALQRAGGCERASRVSSWRGGAGADELRWRVDEDSRWVRRGLALPAIRKRIVFRVLFLCLSRACLGKTISFSSYKMAPQKICVF